VLQELESLLQAREHDAAFWSSLRLLLSDLVAASMGVGGWTVRGAEVLSPERIDSVVGDIRRSLAAAGRAPGQRSLLSHLAAPGLCAVLLMGMALGCDESSSGPAADLVSGEDAFEAEDGFTPDFGPETSQWTLEEYVSNSDLSLDTQTTLLACLSRFDVTDRELMLAYFRDHTPEKIAEYLEMLSGSEFCSNEPDTIPYDVYKGVSFPARTRKSVS